jgi:hypothetical protein
VRKPSRSVIRHIERGDKTHDRRVPRVLAAKVADVVHELDAEARGIAPRDKSWEHAIQRTQRQTRAAWLAAAAALDATQKPLQTRPNQPPDYDQADPSRVRAAQRAAGLYQSHLEGSGLKAPAAAIARLRNVSRVDLVHDKRPAQVLLLAHASDRVGPDRSADHDLRWTRAGAAGLADGRERVNGEGMGSNANLAARMRALVAKMPTIDTEARVLKQKLTRQFARLSPQQVAPGSDMQPKPGAPAERDPSREG